MWHEARRSEKKVHDMMDAARKRAQRRAIFLAKRRGDPQQSIQVIGSRCRTYRDDGLYQATQDQQGLIPWNGKEDILIDRSNVSQTPANKGTYPQVGFSYDGNGKEEVHSSDDEDEDEDDEEDEDEDDYEEFNSDDGDDEQMEAIANDFGVKRYGWIAYMDKKAKEEEKRQKEVIKGDPAIRKLSRKQRRKASQIEREREREAALITGTHVLHHDPYRSRSQSRSPSYSRRHSHGHSDDGHRSIPKAQKIEYITEFGSSPGRWEPMLDGVSPPLSPLHNDASNRTSSAHILEALHVDPASGASLDKEKNAKVVKTPASTSSALAKLKGPEGGSLKKETQSEKETPQERLKRIMSKQLNKQRIALFTALLAMVVLKRFIETWNVISLEL